MNDDTNDVKNSDVADQPQSAGQAEEFSPWTTSSPAVGGFGSIGRRIARQRHIGKVAAVVALAALLGAGYAAGGGPSDHSVVSKDTRNAYSQDKSVGAGALVPAPAALPANNLTSESGGGSGNDSTVTSGDGSLTLQVGAPGDSNVIIKTGQLSLQVANLDQSIAAAQSAVAAAGGYVSSSNRSGTDQYASATITFRIPAAKWDDALGALRKLGTKVLSESTNSSDVTMQVVDLNARLDNLKKTEAAFQAILARAVSVTDVLAVQNQLSQTQGQIEQLTAQRDHLKDQAAMSTLTVALTLPGPTVTATTTQEWTLGNQVDEAAAALVRIAQGLATLGVWAVIVALPVAAGLLILFLILIVARRLGRRGKGASPEAAA